MKMPVSWHKERLANMGLSMEYILRQVEQLQCTLQRAAEEYAVLREQIKRAEAEGRDGFDQEKFNIKRATQ